MKIVPLLFATFIFSGCSHTIHHVKDIRSVGDGNIEVEKCDYYIDGFLGTGGYQGCKVEIVKVK